MKFPTVGENTKNGRKKFFSGIVGSQNFTTKPTGSQKMSTRSFCNGILLKPDLLFRWLVIFQFALAILTLISASHIHWRISKVQIDLDNWQKDSVIRHFLNESMEQEEEISERKRRKAD